MFKSNFKQLFSARHLNKSNKVVFQKNSSKLKQQLLVLKQVNNLILGRKNNQEIVAINYFGQLK
jgi:hypothetical protein